MCKMPPIHLLAIFPPAVAGQRFIVSCDGAITMQQIAALIQQQRPQLVSRVTTKQISHRLIHLAALLTIQPKKTPLLEDESSRQQSTNQSCFWWQPSADTQTAILSAVDSLISAEQKK